MPPQGHTSTQPLYQPFQSTTAQGVNNLAAKLLMALFPPGQSFFRLTLDDFTLAKIQQRAQANQQDPDDARAAYEDALSKIERAVMNRMEQRGTRTQHFDAFVHLIICGNALLYVKKDGSEKMFPLDRYVVKRDLDGDVLEIITKEPVARMSLPLPLQAFLRSKETASPETDHEKNVDVYTWVKRQDDGSWTVHQELDCYRMAGTDGSYPKDKCAFIPLRWHVVHGEDYGRGHVEENLGDTVSCEALSQALVEISAQAAKVHWLVNESGSTDKEMVAKAPNGAVYHGNADDVKTLALDKMQDFQVTKGTLDDCVKRLERAFLSAQSVQRDAERVTAEEIRAMIGELEQGLGGVYALMATDFQRPLAARQLFQMTKAGDLPPLPKDLVSPQIVTGMDGLSRQSDLQKLDTFLSGVAETFGQPAMAQYVNVGEYIKRRGAALGIDMNGLVKTDEQVQQEQQAAQQAEATQKLGPSAIKAGSDLMKHGASLAAQQGGQSAQAAQPQQQ